MQGPPCPGGTAAGAAPVLLLFFAPSLHLIFTRSVSSGEKGVTGVSLWPLACFWETSGQKEGTGLESGRGSMCPAASVRGWIENSVPGVVQQ